MFDVNGLMLDEGDEGKYFTMESKKSVHIFAPRLGFAARQPLAEHFVFGFESFLHPFYCVLLKQDMAYSSSQAKFDYSGDNSLFRVSSPYISAKATLDAFDYVRFITKFSYQRLDFQQMGWADDWNSLEGKNDVQTMTTFRVGLELLSGKIAKARVRGGVYRQTEWNKSTYRGDTEKESRWIISFGTEM